MIDVICRDTKKLEFEKWCDMYDFELQEIFSIEGCNLDGTDFEDWRKEFYDAGGAIYE